VIRHEDIRALAAELVREMLIASHASLVTLPPDVPSEHRDRLAAMLERPPTPQELWAFQLALYDALETAQKPGASP